MECHSSVALHSKSGFFHRRMVVAEIIIDVLITHKAIYLQYNRVLNWTLFEYLILSRLITQGVKKLNIIPIKLA